MAFLIAGKISPWKPVCLCVYVCMCATRAQALGIRSVSAWLKLQAQLELLLPNAPQERPIYITGEGLGSVLALATTLQSK